MAAEVFPSLHVCWFRPFPYSPTWRFACDLFFSSHKVANFVIIAWLPQLTTHPPHPFSAISLGLMALTLSQRARDTVRLNVLSVWKVASNSALQLAVFFLFSSPNYGCTADGVGGLTAGLFMLQVSSQASTNGAKEFLRAAANHPRRATAGGALQVLDQNLSPPVQGAQLTPSRSQESDAVASFVRDILNVVSADPEVCKSLGKSLKESKMVIPHPPQPPSTLWCGMPTFL